MTSDDFSRKQGASNSDPRFKHDKRVSVFGSYDAFRLAEDMRELAARFKVKPGQGWQHDRWEIAEGDSYGLALCSTGACERCGCELISAVESGERRRRGWLCGSCAPLSSAGRVDHAEWVAARRALA